MPDARGINAPVDDPQVLRGIHSAGAQDFALVGSAAFTAAGPVRVLGPDGPNALIVEVSVNNALGADMQIFVNLQTTMQAGDFI